MKSKCRFILSVVLLLFTIVFMSSCEDYSNYKNEVGYEAYISDRDTGVETSYCNITEAMDDSEEAREYYNNNRRKQGNFIITNYEDGICINQIIHPYWFDGVIPEILDGLPVVKLGCYIDEDGYLEPFLRSDYILSMGMYHADTLKIPSTVKYISKYFSPNYWGVNYEVDEGNPYYISSKGKMYVLVDGNKVEFIDYSAFTDFS